MKNYTVDFYQKETGELPAMEYLDSIDKKMRAKIIRIIDLLEENGPTVRLPYSGPLGDGIFEIRAKQGSDISRILYFFFIGKRIILTNGFTKKTQKTPTSVIATAKQYRSDYERRHSHDKI